MTGVFLVISSLGVLTAAEDPEGRLDQFVFREPAKRSYRVARPSGLRAASVSELRWLQAWSDRASNDLVYLGDRVVIQLKPGADIKAVLDRSRLKLSRVLGDGLYVTQAPGAMVAMEEAQALSESSAVEACYPVQRRRMAKWGPYASKPTDPYFKYQWYFEHRGEDGQSLGVDMNMRSAWPWAQGEGIAIALADDGVDLNHPDLKPRGVGAPHRNFETGESDGNPTSYNANHGTAVAGLIAAEGYDGVGMLGAAYRAQLASWVIFGRDDYLVSDEQMADMFQYASNRVAVQNHSWGNASDFQLDPTYLERRAISNAITFGRSGKGVIMVRAAGNRREDWGNANDDGYASSPQVIAVSAVRTDGRAASYSSPGACILVAAPSGDAEMEFPMVFTTDRVGEDGYNQAAFTNDFANYAFDDLGFSGTSASTPQIAGLAGLMLSANPGLTYRDVQQILILSARHFDAGDPDLTTNHAGLVVSHNDGFGVPDAGVAVELARTWNHRPAMSQIALSQGERVAIPDEGLFLELSGPDVPPGLARIRCRPSLSPDSHSKTVVASLVDVGMATHRIAMDLTGKVALIERGTNLFSEKIHFAAEAGAVMAVVFNNRDGDQLVRMAETDFSAIPAVFISENHGRALQAYVEEQPEVAIRLMMEPAICRFNVPDSITCEHVGVRIRTDHPRRGDLRITLTSPGGTTSVLQHLNYDEMAGPVDWTYYSTHHFFESSQGQWTVSILDEWEEQVGNVEWISLIINGVKVTDNDHDGLDDAWELLHFNSLASGPRDDPDQDGFSNLRESLMGSNPLINEQVFKMHLAVWNPERVRLSWPSSGYSDFEVWATSEVNGIPVKIEEVPGTFPETLWFEQYTNTIGRFYHIRQVPAQ